MDYLVHIAIVISIYSVLAQGLNLLMGFTGIVSVMQASFCGIGAYVSALLALRLGAPFPIAFAVATAVAAVAGFAVGTAVASLRGDALALVTFGLAMILYDVFNNWIDMTKGPLGIPGIPDPFAGRTQWLVFVAAQAFVALVMVRRIDRAPFGRLLKAIRDDEGLVALLGRDVRPVKALVFMLSASLAGAAGSTYAHYVTFIDPSSFTVMESVTLLAMVIIGGMASTVGPLLGAGFLIVTTEALRFAGLPAAVAAPLRQTVFGLLVVLAMIYRPQGLMGRYGLSS